MQKIPAYCSNDFLEVICNYNLNLDYKSEKEKEDKEENLENYLILKKLITNKCHLFIENIAGLNRDNPIIKKLIKDSSCGFSTIENKFNKKTLSKLPSLLLLINSKDEIIDEQKCTAIRINQNNKNNLKKLIEKNHYKIDSKFNVIENLHKDLPLTGIIIADPYLNNSESFKNIKIIINNIIKKHTTKYNKIDISLFVSSDKFDNIEIRNNFVNFKEDLILDFNKINLSIYIAGKETKLHDRHIFTNYHHFFSGNSFNGYFDKENKPKIESLLIVTALGAIDDNPYFEIVKYYRELAIKVKKEGKLYGDGENVLFNFDKFI